MKKVGLYLHRPVFAHGQLYVVLSRVSRPEDIIVYIDPSENRHGWYGSNPYTDNVVYTTIIQEEIEKFKKSDDYRGPDFFDEGKNL